MATTYNGFGLLLYPDNPTHEKAVDMLMRLAPVWEWKFFLILHDKDLLDGSESEQEGMEENKGTPGLKKAHWHVVVVSGDRKSPGTIAIQLGIEKRFVQGLSSIRGMLRYLIHTDFPDKHQYDPAEVICNDDYSKYLGSQSITRTWADQLGEFLEMFENMAGRGGRLTFTAVLSEARKHGLARWVATNHQMVTKVIEDEVAR